jgi:hypothetical protein
MFEIPEITHLRTKKPLSIQGSVAVVGSSDLLTANEYGEEIDGHDLVFRFNLASLDEQYASHIGTKADYYLICPKLTTLEYPLPEPQLSRFKLICRKHKVICYQGHSKNVEKFNKRPFTMNLEIEQINEVFSSLLGHNKWAFSVRHHPRNGIKLLACLLRAGVHPTLYGFDIEDRETNCHYFDDEVQFEGKDYGHKPSIEFKLLRELASKELITVR